VSAIKQRRDEIAEAILELRLALAAREQELLYVEAEMAASESGH
jgi:hypothetical protein